MILSRDLMSDETTVAMLGHIAARTRVCAMVIDREGRILAVNQSGLDLLEVALSDICGQVWAERWQSSERERADLALARDRRSPGREFGGALDENQPRVMLRGVVQHTVCCRAVTLGLGDAGLEVGVIEIEQ